MMPRMQRQAPAKINLTLKITGRRDDGYHILDSLVIFADLHDTLTLTPADEDSVVITGPYGDALKDVADHDNIIIKALTAYRKKTGWKQQFTVTLDKHIPVAAGIGGGSSNAAAMLQLLNDHCPKPITEEEMTSIGLRLGADLPVCLGAEHHHLWRMRGIGERLDRVDYPPSASFGIILINPRIAVPTGAIFTALSSQQFNDDGFGHGRDLSAAVSPSEFRQWLKDGNSLEAPATAFHPDVLAGVTLSHDVNECRGFIHAGMSGSGATAFALFATEDDARHAYQTLGNSSFWSWVGGINAC